MAAAGEAAALRAKIQAMKNLLAAKRGQGTAGRAWGAGASANRVWRRDGGEKPAAAAATTKRKAWRRPVRRRVCSLGRLKQLTVALLAAQGDREGESHAGQVRWRLDESAW